MNTAVLSPATALTSAYRNGPVGGAMYSPVTTTTTSNGAGASARKRKRATVVSYSEIKEVDASGRTREVIVLDDTPPPSTLSPASTRYGASASVYPPLYSAPVRTRARAAKEAESAAAASAAALAPPPAKRRKRNNDPDQHQHRNHATTTTTTTVTAPSTARISPKATPACDDKEGHYIIVPDDLIFNRYRTVRLLGQGTFGKVVEAIDAKTQNRVAIKIIRAIPKYRDASKIEVRVLTKLKERDPLNRHKCIHLLHWFDHRNHICIVTELLGMCLYDFLKDNRFEPFPRHHIQSFARQLLGSVAFLHDLKLVHTDLKPENILLVRNDYRTISLPVPGKRSTKTKRILTHTDIHLIDFGSATFEEEYHSTVVSTRHYRAPEIILGLGWSYPCDVYSLGCILVEFYTGNALFQTHDNLEHLAMMEKVMNRMPDRFARAGYRSKPEFFKEVGGAPARLDWPKPKASQQTKKDVKAMKTLSEIIPPTDPVNRQFYDLVQKLLAFDPAQRITVRDALQHPYFSVLVPEEV